MQSFYAEQFEREMGCSEAEWLGWLPQAIGANEFERDDAVVHVRLPASASLSITWQVMALRVIGSARIPRLLVHFRFERADAAQRLAFMKRFDLYMQRGGG